MSEIHLNDLSKIYQDQIAEKKDDSYLETDMKKRQKNNEKARKDMEKMGTSMKNPHFEEKRLDPVGQEDGDVDNDGDKDSSDKYLMKRRKAIGKAIAKEESEVDECWKTHKKVGMKMKGGKLVNDCRPKNEEVEEVDENRAAARSAGGYKDDSKKQPDPSKKGFTGIGNMSIDQIRKMSARIEKEKSAKK